MDIRPYTADDRDACLAVFDSNVPQFFRVEDRKGFEGVLDTGMCPYFVMEHDGAVVGCGGYAIEKEASLASLVWGMVRGDLQKKGIGRYLAMFRLREISKAGGAERVRLGTAPSTAAFYQKLGFKIVSVRPDGYGVGVDRVEMMMKLSVCS